MCAQVRIYLSHSSLVVRIRTINGWNWKRYLTQQTLQILFYHQPVNDNLSIIIQTGQKMEHLQQGAGLRNGRSRPTSARNKSSLLLFHTQTPYVRCSSGQDRDQSHGTSTEKVACALFIYIQWSKGGNNMIMTSRNSASVLSASCTVQGLHTVSSVATLISVCLPCLTDWQIVHMQSLHQCACHEPCVGCLH